MVHTGAYIIDKRHLYWKKYRYIYTCYIYLWCLFIWYQIRLTDKAWFAIIFQWFTGLKRWMPEYGFFSAPVGLLVCVTPAQWSCARSKSWIPRQTPSRFESLLHLALPIAMLETPWGAERYKLYKTPLNFRPRECGEATHQPIFQICCK